MSKRLRIEHACTLKVNRAIKAAMGGTVTDIEGETQIIWRGAGPRAAWAQTL